MQHHTRISIHLKAETHRLISTEKIQEIVKTRLKNNEILLTDIPYNKKDVRGQQLGLQIVHEGNTSCKFFILNQPQRCQVRNFIPKSRDSF